MCGEGTVHVEEKGGVCTGCGEGGKEDAFDWVVMGCVFGGEPLAEKRILEG